MGHFLLLLLLLVPITVFAQDCPEGYALNIETIPPKQTIQWVPCGEDYPQATLQCGSVKVPLDYTGITPGVLTLPLARIQADPAKANGKSIVFNPGGPGDSGILKLAQRMLNMTGGEYNIVSFDPRGVGVTIPFECTTVSSNYTTAPLDNPEFMRNYYTELAEHGAECAKPEWRTLGQLMGTSYVARDINAIFEASGEDGLIRYWGMSYGTVLGATLAAMFPDKIDRMVLDGNINPAEFYHGYFDESAAGADPALKYFFEQCYEDRGRFCSFAPFGDSADDLEQKFMTILNASRTGAYNFTDTNGRDISYTYIQGEFYGALRDPDYFRKAANLTTYLYQQMNGMDSNIQWEQPPPEEGVEDMKIHAVNCGDWDDLPGTVQDFTDWLAKYQERSSFAGDSPDIIGIVYQCAHWQLNARGKYNGTWSNIETKHPILFVNSPYDPSTPIESAMNSSAGFVGSKLLVHKGAGHCSTASTSTNCTEAAVAHYFTTGELPDVTKPCKPDIPEFISSALAESAPGLKRRKRSIEADYPAAIRKIQRQNDHLLPKQGALEARDGPSRVARDENSALKPSVSEADVVAPATCTPMAQGADSPDGKEVEHDGGRVMSDEEMQKGLSDFKEACNKAQGDRWFYRLVCDAVG